MITRINKTIPSVLRGVLAAAVLMAMPAFGTPFLFPTFNAAFTLAGEAIPEPSTLLLIGAALVALALLRIRR
jgi:hypothetical protein